MGGLDKKTTDEWDKKDEKMRQNIAALNEEKIKNSKHSEKRLKQRAGLSRKSAQRNIEKAMAVGIPAKDFVGSARRYLDKHMHHENHKKGIKLFVYNYYVYVVNVNDKTVITMWHLPSHYRRVYDAIKKKKTNNEC